MSESHWRNLTDFIIENLEQHRDLTNDRWLSSLLLQIYDRKSAIESPSVPTTSVLATLPTEVLTLILDNSVLKNEYKSLGMVCKEWYFVISNFRRRQASVSIKCDSSLFEAGISNVLSFYERPQKLVLETSKYANYFRGNYKQLGNIKELEVKLTSELAIDSLFEQMILSVLKQTVNLESFKFDNYITKDILKGLQHLPKLQTLHYQIPKNWWSECITTTIALIPKLKSLSLSCNLHIRGFASSDQLKELGQSCHNLEYLKLSNLSEGSEVVLSNVTSANLKELSLCEHSSLSKLREHVLISFLRRNSNVSRLSLDGNWSGCDMSISDNLAIELGKLSHLEMYCTTWDLMNLHCLQISKFGSKLESLLIGENRFGPTCNELGIHPPATTLRLLYDGCPNLKKIRLVRTKKEIEYSREDKESSFVCTYQAVLF